jgi:hypothetical protein
MAGKKMLLAAVAALLLGSTGCCRWCDRMCGNSTAAVQVSAPQACVPVCCPPATPVYSAPVPASCPPGCAPVPGWAAPGR